MALFWDGTSTKYQLRHIVHASIGVGDETFEYDLSDIVQGETAPEIAAYLAGICLDVMRRQVVLMTHCGLAGITYPSRYSVFGMDNTNSNPAALLELEGFRTISELLEEFVTCIEEAALNDVDMSACVVEATAALRLPPRAPRPQAGPLALATADAAAMARARARAIPSRAALNKKPYVVVNTAARQRRHDLYGYEHSIFLAAVRFQIVQTSKLQGGLAASVAAHVAKFDGHLSLGETCISGSLRTGGSVWRAQSTLTARARRCLVGRRRRRSKSHLAVARAPRR